MEECKTRQEEEDARLVLDLWSNDMVLAFLPPDARMKSFDSALAMVRSIVTMREHGDAHFLAAHLRTTDTTSSSSSSTSYSSSTSSSTGTASNSSSPPTSSVTTPVNTTVKDSRSEGTQETLRTDAPPLWSTVPGVGKPIGFVGIYKSIIGPGGGRVPVPEDETEEEEEEDFDAKLKRLNLRWESELMGCMFPEYWRNGFGTEAAHHALEWAFRSGIYGEVIHGFSDPRNVGSIGLLLKLGMRQLADPTKPHPLLLKAEGTAVDEKMANKEDIYVVGEVDLKKTVKYMNDDVLKLAVTAEHFLARTRTSRDG